MKFLVAPRAGVVINALPCSCNGTNQCGTQTICGTQCVSQSICGTQCASLAICDTRCSSQLIAL